MALDEEFLEKIWHSIINASMAGRWIDPLVKEAEEYPEAPFADAGQALKRLLDRGAAREDLCRVVRWASYEAVFAMLTELEEQDVEAVEGLHESLLGADPSGHEGRPLAE